MNARKQKPMEPSQNPDLKWCNHGEHWVDRAEFGKNRQTPDGLMYYCRACAAEKQREFRIANPTSAAASRKRYLDKLRARNDQQHK